MLRVLLILIFIRPFICSLAFPYINYLYSSIFLGFLVLFLVHSDFSFINKKMRTIKYPLILFIAALFISIIFSSDRFNSVKELYKYVNGILLFLFVISLDSKNRLRIIKAITLGGFLISLLAIYQYLFGFQHLLDYLSKSNPPSLFALDYIQRRRVYFPFVTPNALGGYLAIIIPLIISTQNAKNRNPIGLRRYIALISVSLALLLTKSIGALISVSIGLITYSYLQSKLDKKRVLLFISMLLIIIASTFLLRQRATGEHTLPTFSVIQRFIYWRDTLEVIKKYPWQGIGLGNFNLSQVRYAHNSYLQIWAEMGIIGLISILWLISSVFKTAIDNIKICNNKVMSGAISANVVFLTHNLIDFSFFLPEIALIWWVIFGLNVRFEDSA